MKHNELESAQGRPLHLSFYEPERTAPYFAASVVRYHQRIPVHGWQQAHQYVAFETGCSPLRATRLPGLADERIVGAAYEYAVDIAQQHMHVAAEKMGLGAEGKKWRADNIWFQKRWSPRRLTTRQRQPWYNESLTDDESCYVPIAAFGHLKEGPHDIIIALGWDSRSLSSFAAWPGARRVLLHHVRDSQRTVS